MAHNKGGKFVGRANFSESTHHYKNFTSNDGVLASSFFAVAKQNFLLLVS
jgi:hypothetical protein